MVINVALNNNNTNFYLSTGDDLKSTNPSMNNWRITNRRNPSARKNNQFGEPKEFRRTWRPLTSKVDAYSEAVSTKIQESKSRNRFRLVCWNILGESNVGKSISQNASCDTLNWSSRVSQITRHLIVDVSADIVCLQEVDLEAIKNGFFESLIGYDWIFKKRTGVDQEDGCAILYKTSEYDEVYSELIEFFQPDNVLLDRGNVAVAAVLKHKSTEKLICVCTTHLLFNPNRGDVKLAQLGVLCSAVKKILSRFDGCAFVLCGDFNSTPSSAVYELLTSGELKNVIDFDKREISGQCDIMHRTARRVCSGAHGGAGDFLGTFYPRRPIRGNKKISQSLFDNIASAFRDGGDCDDPSENHHIKTGLGRLHSAYSLQSKTKAHQNALPRTGEPAFSIYSETYRGMVDFVLFKGLSRLAILNMPHRALLDTQGILPCKLWPSDHLSLAVDFEFK